MIVGPMLRLPKPLSLRLLILIAVLIALQLFPYTGIFLMMLAGAFVTGLLVHVFFVSLFFDAYRRRVPRFLMIVPFIAYGSYYVAYGLQATDIARKSAELSAANPGKLIDFDATTQALVAKYAKEIVERYAIPVAYAPINPEGYYSYRMIRRDQCKLPRDNQGRIQVSYLTNNLCLIQFPEAPRGQIVKAVLSGHQNRWHQERGISEQLTTVFVGDKEIGSYRSASVWRLPAFPMGFIGCGLLDMPSSWQCSAEFLRKWMPINAVPAGLDESQDDTPLTIMLGLKKYTAADLADFKGYAANDAALQSIAEEPQREVEDAFATLADILDGQSVVPQFRLGSTLAKEPKRLAPLAEKMAQRYIALERSEPRKTTNTSETIRALGTALVSLPADAFLSVADELQAVVHEPKARERSGALYVRAADAGPQTFPLYKTDFLTIKAAPYQMQLPVLAICRIGEADAETIAEMKRRITDAKQDMNYRTALFVALMKLNEAPFLSKLEPDMPWQTRPWAKAVLEGKGETAIGPNNCSPWNRGGPNGLWPLPGPSLYRVGGKMIVKTPQP